MNPGTTISEKMSMEEQLKQHGGGGQFADMFSPHNPIDAFQVRLYDVFELFHSKIKLIFSLRVMIPCS